jgi:hypothetical protein
MFIIIDTYTIILQLLKNSDIEIFDKVICTFIYKLSIINLKEMY